MPCKIRTESAALGWPDGASGQRYPIDLVLEDASEIPVLLWTAPNMTVAPQGERTKLLHDWMLRRDRVANRQLCGIEDANITAQPM